MDLRKHPRWWQAIMATIGNYWWEPCPVCGEKFGGHEMTGIDVRINGRWWGVCRNCVAASWRKAGSESGARLVFDIAERG